MNEKSLFKVNFGESYGIDEGGKVYSIFVYTDSWDKAQIKACAFRDEKGYDKEPVHNIEIISEFTN
jgi:hypothetical protein